MKRYFVLCAWCGRRFRTLPPFLRSGGPHPKYCSSDCKKAAAYHRVRNDPERWARKRARERMYYARDRGKGLRPGRGRPRSPAPWTGEPENAVNRPGSAPIVRRLRLRVGESLGRPETEP